MKDRGSTHSFLLRLPSQLYRRLERTAESLDTSVNRLCCRLLNSAVPSTAGSLPSAAPTPNSPEHPNLVVRTMIGAVHKVVDSNLEGIILFGSRARGTHTEISDYDLLIVVRDTNTVSRELLTRIQDQFFKDRSLKNLIISPHVISIDTLQSNPSDLALEAATEGIVLFDPQFKVNRVLIELRWQIIEGKFKREQISGHPYWLRDEQLGTS